MKKKIICAVMAGVITATCAAPAFACTPNFTIPDSYFKNIKVQ